MSDLKYKRVLLKLSGEALSSGAGFGISEDKVKRLAEEIKKISDLGVEIGIVTGGGNFWRGRDSFDMDRPTADNIGMLATIMNSLALKSYLESLGQKAEVMTAFSCDKIAKLVDAGKAKKLLASNSVVIFAGGTGNPFFTTDSGAALRAAEINADVLLLAKSVDAVYSDDPKKNKNAIRYDRISYDDVLEKNLKVMDGAAIAIMRDEKIKIKVFAADEKDGILSAVKDEDRGTVVE
ncbi:MAG: UMP kinase [Clostridiales Family XIII bacterium]|jgi:uridylate kinase|nr:UMP kinase [Clostridiales Family XIII bacterium]